MAQLTQLAVQKLNAFVLASAQAYGVKPENIRAGFTVDPLKEQMIIGKIKESAQFLNMITMKMVDNQMGQVLTIDQVKSLASKTDTSVAGKVREPRAVGDSSGNEYRCHQVDSDWGISFAHINEWAHEPRFNLILAAVIRERQSLDLIKVGWNGTSDAPTSDKSDDTLSDVGIGWPKLIKDNNPAHYLDSEEITVTDKMNLDVIALEAKHALPKVHRNNSKLVLIAGSDLTANEKEKFYAKNGRTPTEKQKIEMKQTIGTFGGMSTYDVPEFPAKALMVTTFANLQIIIQKGTSFNRMVNRIEKNQMEYFLNRNMDYAIGDYDLSIFIPDDKIILEPAPAQ